MRVFTCKPLQVIALLLLSLVFTTANAIEYKDINFKDVTPANNLNSWIVGGGLGVANLHLDNSTSVFNGALVPPPSNQDLYSINNNSSAKVLQLFAGYRWHEERRFFPFYDVTFRYEHYYSTNITGTVMQYSLPEFLNYHYTDSYDSNLFLLAGKFDVIQIQKVLPYVSGGIGFVLNHLNNYSETAIAPVTPRISPGYGGKTSTNAALTLGAGLDFIITDTTWVTLGYEHLFQAGNVSTGHGEGSWSPASLRLGNSNMDTVFINLTFNVPQAFRR